MSPEPPRVSVLGFGTFYPSLWRVWFGRPTPTSPPTQTAVYLQLSHPASKKKHLATNCRAYFSQVSSRSGVRVDDAEFFSITPAMDSRENTNSMILARETWLSSLRSPFLRSSPHRCDQLQMKIAADTFSPLKDVSSKHLGTFTALTCFSPKRSLSTRIALLGKSIEFSFVSLPPSRSSVQKRRCFVGLCPTEQNDLTNRTIQPSSLLKRRLKSSR